MQHLGSTLGDPPDTMHDVFLSYSRADSAIMRRVHDDLRAEGLSVWIDQTGLQPGEPDWLKAIQNAIEHARCLLVVMSPQSKASEWVNMELTYARIQKKRTFCVLAVGEPETAVPILLIAAQWVDVREDLYAPGMQHLVSAICGHIGIESLSAQRERLAREEAERQRAAEIEAQRIAEEAARQAAEKKAERQRKAEERRQRRAAEEARQQQATLEQQRKAYEETERQRLITRAWERAADEFEVNDVVMAAIIWLNRDSAVAQLSAEPLVEGIIPYQELADSPPHHAEEVVLRGDVVDVRILRFEPEQRVLELSLRQAKESDQEKAARIAAQAEQQRIEEERQRRHAEERARKQQAAQEAAHKVEEETQQKRQRDQNSESQNKPENPLGIDSEEERWKHQLEEPPTAGISYDEWQRQIDPSHEAQKTPEGRSLPPVPDWLIGLDELGAPNEEALSNTVVRQRSHAEERARKQQAAQEAARKAQDAEDRRKIEAIGESQWAQKLAAFKQSVQPPAGKYHVYLSYNAVSNELAQGIASDLQAAGLRVTVGVASRRLVRSRQKAIEASDCFVQFYSQSFPDSHWMGIEVELARKLGKGLFFLIVKGQPKPAQVAGEYWDELDALIAINQLVKERLIKALLVHLKDVRTGQQAQQHLAAPLVPTWNPLKLLRLVEWIFVQPGRYLAAKEAAGRERAEKTVLRVMAVFAWLPLLLLTIGFAVGTLPVEQDVPLVPLPIWYSVLVLLEGLNIFLTTMDVLVPTSRVIQNLMFAVFLSAITVILLVTLYTTDQVLGNGFDNIPALTSYAVTLLALTIPLGISSISDLIDAEKENLGLFHALFLALGIVIGTMFGFKLSLVFIGLFLVLGIIVQISLKNSERVFLVVLCLTGIVVGVISHDWAQFTIGGGLGWIGTELAYFWIPALVTQNFSQGRASGRSKAVFALFCLAYAVLIVMVSGLWKLLPL